MTGEEASEVRNATVGDTCIPRARAGQAKPCTTGAAQAMPRDNNYRGEKVALARGSEATWLLRRSTSRNCWGQKLNHNWGVNKA